MLVSLSFTKELRKVKQETTAPQTVHLKEHRSVKNTNISYRIVWNQRDTTRWDFIYCITPLEKHATQLFVPFRIKQGFW